MRVSYTNICVAYGRWCQQVGDNEYASFRKFLNYKVWPEADPVKLNLLMGPHHVAIIKIWHIRNKERKRGRIK